MPGTTLASPLWRFLHPRKALQVVLVVLVLFHSGHGFRLHLSTAHKATLSSRCPGRDLRRSFVQRSKTSMWTRMQLAEEIIDSTNPPCRLREWCPEDNEAVCQLILQTQLDLEGVPSGFNCEGPLDTDCGTIELTQSSYIDVEENRFLVALSDKDEIVGTAALTVGTAISTLKSGASLSVPSVGAIRRVCVAQDLTDRKTRESVLEALLDQLENGAEDAGCQQLIALGFPESRSTFQPTPSILSRRGFREIGILPDTPVAQFSVDLPKPRRTAQAGEEQPKPAQKGAARSFSLLVGRGSGVVIVASLLVILAGAFGVAGLLGLDISVGGEGNRGAGTPLSMQEVRQMMRDEKLQRTTLDEDESPEALREEAALMRVISGGEIRVK